MLFFFFFPRHQLLFPLAVLLCLFHSLSLHAHALLLRHVFNASDHQLTPFSIHTLPDTSVILSATLSPHYHHHQYDSPLSSLKLHPNVTLSSPLLSSSSSSSSSSSGLLLLRVFRHSGHVVWVRYLTRFDIGLRITLLPMRTKIAIAGWSSSTSIRDTRRLPVCIYTVSNGTLLSCTSDIEAPVPHLPDIVPVSSSAVFMPAWIPTTRTTFPFSVPGVVRYDTKSRLYNDVIELRGGGEQHPGDDRLYGDVDVVSGVACFLTVTRLEIMNMTMSMSNSHTNHDVSVPYELFVHCFDAARPQESMRVRMLSKVRSERTPLFATVTVGSNGCVYIGYEQTVLRGRGLISEIFVHKLNATSTALESIPWIARKGQSVPRVIELPAIIVSTSSRNKTRRRTSMTSSMIPCGVAQIIFLPRQYQSNNSTDYDDSVGVRIWTALNITGEYSIKHNRVVLNGSGMLMVDRPQQWMVFLGRKREPVVRKVPVRSSNKDNVVPEEYGEMEVGGTRLTTSGGKVVVFGMLVQNKAPWDSGPLFTYDIDVPYERM